ncbi:TonB-dependent receptor [Thalassotalea euphylliae]|uniref:TonB-dependent receptor n=1 Tax=Thalassotalea euphylliae TaxID=1655234 RepID=A0A3E0TM76_9GAMM|nr:TonB-dependent receptor [Thalassotalea euphylliae]REL25457.1 TonB-dependent receptor [Thalassotalea euphylliae]
MNLTNQKRNKLGLAVAAALSLTSLPTQVFAAQAAQDESEIERITVTSQKRVERLSEIPVAVSVLRSDQIDNTFTAGFEGLQTLVPSVSFRKGTTTRNSAITVRGIGTISFSVAAEPSVSTVVDGVVLGRSGQAFTDLYDLERIEVLRGPQGTLFGKNASAGVVNITTKRPTGETEGMVEATLMQDNEYRLKAKIEGAITDNVNASLVATKSAFDGNLFNVYNNEQVNGYDKEGMRLMVDAEISNNTNMLFIFETMEADDDCCADIEGLPSGRNPASEAAPNSNGIVNGVADLDLDQRRIDHDFESRTVDEHTAFSMQLEHDFGDYTFTSITAYREWENTEFREGDFTSIAGESTEPVFGVPFQLHDVGPQSWDQFSQEFRLTSPVGQSLEWLVGAFFWQKDSERNFTRDASCQNNNGQLASEIGFYLENELGVANPSEQAIADFISQEGITCNANDIVSATAFMRTEFNNWAVFGDGRYHVSEDFRLLFGLRYTDDEVEFMHNRISNDVYGRRGVGVRPASENTNFDGKTTETNTSIKLGAQYDLGDMGMVYATYAQGYKGPGFNVFYNMAEKDTAAIGDEVSDSYELGYKYAVGNLMVNAAVFSTDIEGFQANNFDNSSGVTITRLTNAGDVSTQGFEIDFLWQATDQLSLSGGLASVEAEIDEFFCPDGAACTDRSGLDVPFSPDLKYNLTADYVWEMDGMEVLLNASYIYTDEQFATLPNNNGEFNPAVLLPDYGILNASVALSFNDDAYRVTFIGKNLTDESFFTTYSGDSFRYQVPRDADRHFGVQFRANF